MVKGQKNKKKEKCKQETCHYYNDCRYDHDVDKCREEVSKTGDGSTIERID